MSNDNHQGGLIKVSLFFTPYCWFKLDTMLPFMSVCGTTGTIKFSDTLKSFDSLL